MKHDKHTQGRRLIALLKRRQYTCRELNMAGISDCWWKRVAECLKPHEKLDARKGPDRLNRYRVVTATKWTA